MHVEPSDPSVSKRTLRKVLKAMDGTIKTLTVLERDPPIAAIAMLEMKGLFNGALKQPGNDVLTLISRVNDYRRKYWQLQISISQAFLSYLRGRGYLPSFSPEVDSLKASLPEALIKGDDRIWKYSFDHYLDVISEKVGRSRKEAPGADSVWNAMERKHISRIELLFEMVNKLIPELMMMRSKISYLSSHGGAVWKGIRVRKPKLERIERPLRKILILKRPIPLPKKPRRPRKKLIGGLKREVIEPRGGK